VADVQYQEYVLDISMCDRGNIALGEDYDWLLSFILKESGGLYKTEDVVGVNGILVGRNYCPENFVMGLLQEGPNPEFFLYAKYRIINLYISLI
jgi:hypothetical protein